MAHVFGPVPSRRLGRSLGVDPVPLKTCTWSCVYCQLGRTTSLTIERREYVPVQAILEEARRVVAEKGRESMDWVTILARTTPEDPAASPDLPAIAGVLGSRILDVL
ncbi:MAG TPA: hypothetical protein ENJ97_00600 [Planctomycetes bacterium]|nr:hypothetical protein [Planctomycetota bacterium]